PDGTDRIRHSHACDGDQPPLAARESGSQPQVAEDVVEDPCIEVGGVLRRGLDEVDLLERSDATGNAHRGVRWSEVLDVELWERGCRFAALVIDALPLAACGHFHL